MRENLNDSTFRVPDTDIEIGRFDTNSIYNGVTLTNNGIFDAVRVTIRRERNHERCRTAVFCATFRSE